MGVGQGLGLGEGWRATTRGFESVVGGPCHWAWHLRLGLKGLGEVEGGGLGRCEGPGVGRMGAPPAGGL